MNDATSDELRVMAQPECCRTCGPAKRLYLIDPETGNLKSDHVPLPCNCGAAPPERPTPAADNSEETNE